jgi:hypothetical protein
MGVIRERIWAGKGRFSSLYLLVWKIGGSGTFFGKNIFGVADGLRPNKKRLYYHMHGKWGSRDMF